MSINLQKGQKIDLTKGNTGLKNIVIGLGWDAVKPKLFFSFAPQIDCDASVILLNEGDKFANKNDLVYYGNLRHVSNSVRHMGDNLTGGNVGDDEQVFVDLDTVPQNIKKIVFVVNIYDCIKRKQHFGQINNAFIRIINASNNQELLRYNLSDNYNNFTSIIVGEIYRYVNEWKFAAIGQGTNDPSLSEILKRYM